MARTFTIEKTVYTWDELSDTAKDTAREEWSRLLWDDGSMAESMELLWDGKLTEAGWSDLSDLSFDLYGQGGYPMWSGTMPPFEHAGAYYAVSVGKRHQGGGTYSWSVDVEPADDAEWQDTAYGTPEWGAQVARIEAVERAVTEHLDALSSELFWEFRAEDEYQSSDDVMAEISEANGYEYTKDGHLA